jgi:preprotein translocase subunit SecG
MWYYQGHNINSKTTFTLLTSFFTLVMFLSFVNSDMQLTNVMRFSNAHSNVNGVYLHVTIYKT